MDNLQSPTRFVLWEPLSESEIPLPCLPSVIQVFLSAQETRSPRLTLTGCMAIASQKLYTTGTCMGQTLFFWRPGDRKPEAPTFTVLCERAMDLDSSPAVAWQADVEFTMNRRNCVYFVENDSVKHQDWAIVLDLGSNVVQQIPYPEEQMEGAGKSNHWSAYSWLCLRRPFLKGDQGQ
ncbi:hypothetical protein ZWY2020_036152 [Hordeum vulgare]|nr:hypothetical protein ZWY2020_036152 [Hordeum vulgare]